MDSRGVKTELVERLKAALEGKIEDEEAELTVEGGEAPNEAAEVDCEKSESLGADEAGGQEHLGSGEQDQREVGETLGNVIDEDILNNEEAAMSGKDATNNEPKVDLEKDDKEKVPENESEMEKGSSLEKEKVDETQELTEENPVDQAVPIGLRELRFVLNNDF